MSKYKNLLVFNDFLKLRANIMNEFGNLDCVLKPRSVVIVGVSNERRSLGKAVLDNIKRFNFDGKVYLVSKKDSVVDGIECYPDIQDLPDTIDLAVLTIPQSAVLETVRCLGEKSCKSAVIFASGYAESGDDGAKRQEELRSVAENYGMMLVGPNCMGLTNFKDGIPITFESIEPYKNQDGRKGVAIIAQSGAMANNIREAMIGRNIPITCSVSTGNEASLGLEEYINYFIEDKATGIISVYAEQIRKPLEFLRLSEKARKSGKPIVLHMIGKSKRARESAQSHTGALAGDYDTARALLTSSSVIVTDTVDELFDVIPLLLDNETLGRGGLAVITGSGAVKNISLDLGEPLGIEFSKFTSDTVKKLDEILPDFAVNENPLDYTTAAMKNPSIMKRIIDVVAEDANTSSIIVTQMAGSELNQSDKAEYMVPAVSESKKPAALVILGDEGPLTDTLRTAVNETNVPFYRSLDRAMRAMALVNQYADAVVSGSTDDREDLGTASLKLESLGHNAPSVAEYRAKEWLSKVGIPVPKGRLAKNFSEAKNIADELGWPLVLKAQSPSLLHKSDIGGVALNINSHGELEHSWQKMHESISAAKPDLSLDGILVEKMGRPGVELVVGAKRDDEWGPVIVVGLGGIWIEILNDVRILPALVSKSKVIEELHKLRSFKMLEGARGQTPVDLDRIAEIVQIIGRIMLDNPGIKEIDINPLIASSEGVVALDALII